MVVFVFTLMQVIYVYVPETNHVCQEYSVATVLSLLFVVHIALFPMLNRLYFYISTFRSMCAVPSMAVFCSSLTSWIPGTLLRYFLNDFEMVPVAPVITGIKLVFTFQMRCVSTVRSLYLRIFSTSFFVTFLSPKIATSVNTCFFSIITDCDIRFIVGDGSVSFAYGLHNIVIVPSWIVSTDFGACWYQCFLSDLIPVF